MALIKTIRLYDGETVMESNQNLFNTKVTKGLTVSDIPFSSPLEEYSIFLR